MYSKNQTMRRAWSDSEESDEDDFRRRGFQRGKVTDEEVDDRIDYKEFLLNAYNEIRINFICPSKRNRIPYELINHLKSPYSIDFFKPPTEDMLKYIDDKYVYAFKNKKKDARDFIAEIQEEYDSMRKSYRGDGQTETTLYEYLLAKIEQSRGGEYVWERDLDNPANYSAKYLTLENMRGIVQDNALFDKLCSVEETQFSNGDEYIPLWKIIGQAREEYREEVSIGYENLFDVIKSLCVNQTFIPRRGDNSKLLRVCGNYYLFPSPELILERISPAFVLDLWDVLYISLCCYVSNISQRRLVVEGISSYTSMFTNEFYFSSDSIRFRVDEIVIERYMNLPTNSPKYRDFKEVFPIEFKIFKTYEFGLKQMYYEFVLPRIFSIKHNSVFSILYQVSITKITTSQNQIEGETLEQKVANSIEESTEYLLGYFTPNMRRKITRELNDEETKLERLPRESNGVRQTRARATRTTNRAEIEENIVSLKAIKDAMTGVNEIYLKDNRYFVNRFINQVRERNDEKIFMENENERKTIITYVPAGYYPSYGNLKRIYRLDQENLHTEDDLGYNGYRLVTRNTSVAPEEVSIDYGNYKIYNERDEIAADHYNSLPRNEIKGQSYDVHKLFNLTVAYERMRNENVMYVWRERFEIVKQSNFNRRSEQRMGEKPPLNDSRIVYYHYTPSSVVLTKETADNLYSNELFYIEDVSLDEYYTFNDKAISEVKSDIFEKINNIRNPQELPLDGKYPSRDEYERFNQNDNVGFWFVEIKRLVVDVQPGRYADRHKQSMVFTLERFLNNYAKDLVEDDTEFWLQYKTSNATRIPPASLITDIILYKKCDGLKRLKIGFFFPYVLKQQYSKYQELFNVYQCYGEQQIKNIKETDDCFLYALLQHEPPNVLTVDEINYIKSKATATGITFADIQQIVDHLKIEIKVSKLQYSVDKDVGRNATITKIFKSKEPSTRTFSLGYFTWRNCTIPHYFINISFNYRECAIRNLDYLLEHFPEEDPMKLLCYQQTNGQWKFNPKVTPQTSFKFLMQWVKNGMLRPMELSDELRLFERIRRKEYNYVVDMTIRANQKEFEKVEKEEIKYNISNVYFADTETITIDKYHSAFCICYSNYEGTVSGVFYGLHCLEDFLHWIFKRPGNPTVYFHNLKYDGTLFMKYVYMYQLIKKGGKIYEMKMTQNKFDFYKAVSGCKDRFKSVTFKDSLALISMPIKSFNRAFQLGIDEEKEIYPYCAIDYDSLEWCTLENCWKREKPAWNEEKINQFKENLTKMNLIENGKWNVKKYTEYYCMRDVKILRDGFKKFRSMTLELLNIDILSTLTASGLAQKYMARNVYSKINCYQINGLLADMCRKACYGGRCMTRKNEKWHTKGDMCDYDACSLYPSAMHRLKVPTGFAWPMQEKEVSYYLEYLMDEQQEKPGNGKIFSYFIAKIRITKVHEHLDFPLICIKRDGINEYVDYDPLSEDKDNFSCELWVDSIYLQDLIRYQKIEYESCKDEHGNTLGVFWVGTKSSLLSETIEKIYNERVELKKKKNPAQEVLKLIMNSSYGKCIQKAIETKQTFFCTKKECDVHMCNYYTKLKDMQEINDHCFMVNEFYNDDSYTMPHFGAMILSMSKRIMNEVFYAGKCAGCRIYYQDTDSIHIPLADLEKLQTSFKELYGRELTGKDMGQFHVDFEPINGDDKVLSKETIVCGKKCYLDVLQNSRGETSYHSRMKGISENCVKGTASNYGGMIPLYQQLFDHPEDKIHFDLAQWSPQFKMFFSSITSLDEFPRELSFTGKKNELEYI